MPEAALRHEPAAAGHQRAGSPGGTSAPKQGPQPDGQLYPASGMPHSAGLAVDLLPDGYRTLSVSHGKGMQTCLDCKAAPCRSIGAAGCIVLGRQSGVSRNFHERTPDVTHFQASNLWENHILLRGPVVYFRREEPEKGQAWRKCG